MPQDLLALLASLRFDARESTIHGGKDASLWYVKITPVLTWQSTIVIFQTT